MRKDFFIALSKKLRIAAKRFRKALECATMKYDNIVNFCVNIDRDNFYDMRNGSSTYTSTI